MGRGFLTGIFWGAIVSVAILLVSNVTLDRQQLSFPKPEAVPVEVPAGSEFDQARPETDPVVPDTESRPGAEAPGGVTPPADLAETPPAFDTTALEVPQPSIDGPGGLGEVPEVADEIAVEVTGPGPETPVQPIANADLSTPDAPAAAPDTTTEAPVSGEAPATGADTVGEDVAALAPPQTEVPDIAVPQDAPASAAPEAERAPAQDTTSATAPATPTMPSLMPAPEVVEAPSGQGIVRLDGGESFFRPVDEIGDLADGVETDRLPRIGLAETPDQPVVIRRGGEEIIDTPEAAPVPETAEAAPAPVPSGPAIAAWSQDVSVDRSRPLFALVLVHQGAAMPDMDAVAVLPETVAFAVDAGLPSAEAIARAYRDAGREVVMIPSLPIGATPQDVEVALRVNIETIPQAVAVMDASGESFQSDRAAVAQLVDVVTATGHGLITFPRGLNTAHQRAQREGVPAGLIFRDIDGEAQNEEQIMRAMDRAAFRARIDRPVILVGRAEPGTIAAVREWALGSRAATVSFAPVSAALIASPS